MTLVFSATQALLTAEAGATYISCFMGRLDDISVASTEVVREIVEALRPGGDTAQVLAASIRHPQHVVTAARLGCEVATAPAKVLHADARTTRSPPPVSRVRRRLEAASRVRRVVARPGEMPARRAPTS